ncbi:replication initiation protein [Psychrilyobacter atlanticus]|uniref:replication initiation protein n=1 Tax=Psychrilyobacter atlanticus TaxID=271091 RepID=UPI000401C93C|nr:replication initiation protein [Psychrilyobacter atlanticus]
MYYFLKKSDFNLEKYNFNIELDSKLTKKEYQVLKILIDNYKLDSTYSELKKNKWDISEDEMLKVINLLMKKKFQCEFYDESREVSKFFFNIFNIIAFEDEKLIYAFSDSIIKSFEKHNVFNRIGIFCRLNFMFASTKIIYNLILKENKHKGFIELSLEELKTLLGMSNDKYPRFYDFETKVLNPIAKDIEVSENFIWFEKIKESNSKSSKIIGVKIHFSNLYHIKLHKETNNFLREYSDYIQDFTASYKLIYRYINKYGLEKGTIYLKKNYDTVFNID